MGKLFAFSKSLIKSLLNHKDYQDIPLEEHSRDALHASLPALEAKMKLLKTKTWSVLTLSIFILSAAAFAEEKDNTAKGKELYLGEKFKCYTCHGKEGEGGMGPSFKGIGKKHSVDEILERATHRCPPTGKCNPKEIRAIVDYLRTL